MAYHFIVDGRWITNDVEPTEVDHGCIIDVYTARTSTHGSTVARAFQCADFISFRIRRGARARHRQASDKGPSMWFVIP